MKFFEHLVLDHTNRCNDLDRFNEYWLSGKVVYSKETLHTAEKDIISISHDLAYGKLDLDIGLTMITTLDGIRNLVKEYLSEV